MVKLSLPNLPQVKLGLDWIGNDGCILDGSPITTSITTFPDGNRRISAKLTHIALFELAFWVSRIPGRLLAFLRRLSPAQRLHGTAVPASLVDAVSEALHAHDPDDALTQDEIVRLLVQLNQRGLIQCEITPDVEAIFHREDQERRRARRLAVNPLAFRVRLGIRACF